MASPSSGHWYVVLSSRELDRGPVGKTRFGRRIVFWRDDAGAVAALDDRCPHRGASLSLGRIRDGAIACPYHGFRYARDGRCVEVPAEGAWHIPAHFRARALTVREQQDYVWMWRGPAVDDDALPPLPVIPLPPAARIFEECTQDWPAHYTRCVEGVIDHSHLPFVHRKTLGLFRRDPVTRIRVEPFEGGFRTNLMHGETIRHHVDLVYPNVWIQNLLPAYGLSTAFAPVDDRRTEVYCRLYHRQTLPGLRPVMSVWNRISQYLVFHEDMPILETQRPRCIDDADDEKLVPSDAPQMAYRKMRQQVRAELHSSNGVRHHLSDGV